MSTLSTYAERIAAAGSSRAATSFGVVSAAEAAGTAGVAAATTFRAWGATPVAEVGSPQVMSTKRHDLNPARRPEEASP